MTQYVNGSKLAFSVEKCAFIDEVWSGRKNKVRWSLYFKKYLNCDFFVK